MRAGKVAAAVMEFCRWVSSAALPLLVSAAYFPPTASTLKHFETEEGKAKTFLAPGYFCWYMRNLKRYTPLKIKLMFLKECTFRQTSVSALYDIKTMASI